MKTLIRIFNKGEDLEHLLRELYSNGFKEGEVWVVIHCSDTSSELGQQDLSKLLTRLGVSEADACFYTENMRPDEVLVAVQTCEKRAWKAHKILNMAQVKNLTRMHVT